MTNSIAIKGYKANYTFDDDVGMYRGEFVGLNGCVDFYAKDIDSLKIEGDISLRVFLDVCKEQGIEPVVSRPKMRNNIPARLIIQRGKSSSFDGARIAEGARIAKENNFLEIVHQAVKMGKSMDTNHAKTKAYKKPVTR
ncbi:hypothetical protein ACK34S_07995 [Aeromonas hydrophila]|uniref:hypothetical protein n=1 Tax=Aeromonas hydrophila TaxID=644 RepID=UPI003985FE6C